MSLTPSLDVQHVNRLINSPDIYPAIVPDEWLPLMGQIDTGVVMSDPDYIVLADLTGFVASKPLGAGVRNIHIAFLPKARHKAYFQVRAAIRWLFDHTDTSRLVAELPECNRGAVRMAQFLGFRAESRRDADYRRGGVLYDTTIYLLRKEP